MIIRTFKDSHPIALLVAPAIILVFTILNGSGSPAVAGENAMPLWKIIIHLTNAFPHWLMVLLVALLIGFQAFFWNKIVADHELLFRKSLLPLLMYSILAVSLPGFMNFTPVLVVNTIFLVILNRLFRVYKNPEPMPIIFDTSLMIGITTLIYFPCILFFLFVGISLLILKPFSWRDFMIGLMGFCIPFVLVFVWLFWNRSPEILIQLLPYSSWSSVLGTSGIITKPDAPFMATIGLLIMLAIAKIQRNFYKNATRIRLYQQTIFLFLFTASASLFFTGYAGIWRFYLLIIPVCTMLAYYFLLGKKYWWNELLVWIMIAVAIGGNAGMFF